MTGAGGRRALVCSYYLPEPDRDSGSRRLLDHVEFLQRDGWAVDVVALNGLREERYVRGLARRGVATHDGTATSLDELVTVVGFDLVVFAFWQTAERHLPLIRAASPSTRVVVDSVDLQFLRDARRTLGDVGRGLLSEEYGSNLIGEVNVYAAADAVLTVSDREAVLVNDLTAEPGLATAVPDGEDLAPSAVPVTQRRGILFVGSFQHAPNADAVEHLCREIVPRLPPALLARHPVMIVGAGLDATIRSYADEHPAIRAVGWVPSVTPYLHRACLSVVPLRYGAGTKRKLIQTLLAGTPAVTTSIGAEGLDLVDGRDVLIADDAESFAERVTDLVEQRDLWRRLARAGRRVVERTHDRAAAGRAFSAAIASAMERDVKSARLPPGDDHRYWSRMVYLGNQKVIAPIRELLHTYARPGATVAVMGNGSPELLRLGEWTAWPFPMGEDAGHGGIPATAADAMANLEHVRARGAEYLVIPDTVAAWWREQAFYDFVAEVREAYTVVAEHDDAVLVALAPPRPHRDLAVRPLAAAPPDSPRLIAFYLPQFHPIPENDAWWGEGFTEWSNVARARPLFPGHAQPHVPADLGFYDLRLAETRQAQADLARQHGIHGFCYYHYWFEGRRLLERPFDEVLASGEPDLPFCLCWANEPWSRRWHGRDEDVLMPQRYSESDDIAHLRWLLPALTDPRAIRVGGRPVFIVYQARDLPDPARTVETWRREAAREGIDLFLMTVETGWDEGWDATAVGFDAKVLFRPQFTTLRGTPRLDVGGPASLQVHDYAECWPALAAAPEVPYPHFETVCPGWDNSPRDGERAVVLHEPTPDAYGRWLSEVLERTSRRPLEEQIVFVNAWNEWGEGCHLEPDLRHGHGFLEATRDALLGMAGRTNGSRPRLSLPSAAVAAERR